jgi:hypothetical protein
MIRLEASMALDLYVGTLTRYYSGDWEPALLSGGRPGELRRARLGQNGMEGEDPDEIREAVLGWIQWANEEVDLLEERLDWSEEPELPYATARPSEEGLGALQLWASYVEHPDLPRPEEMPEDWTEDPVLVKSLDNDFPSRFPQLLFAVDIWLPARIGEVFDAPSPLLSEEPGEEDEEEQTRFGSIPALLEELQLLNGLTWKADPSTLERWRNDDSSQGNLEALARQTFVAFLDLARQAQERGMPMVLHWT